MNKIRLFSIFSFLLILFIVLVSMNSGCYNADHAVIRLRIDNLPISKQSLSDKIFSFFVKNAHAQTFPPTDVTAIHLAALKGDSVICVKKIDIEDVTTVGSSSYVEFSVPAGDDITILVVGEDVMNDLGQPVPGFAGYYGYAITDIAAGVTKEVNISMTEISWVSGVNINTSFNTPEPGYNTFTWDSSGVRTKYYFTDYSDDTVYYSGYGLSTVITNTLSDFYFYFEFEMFNLKTEKYSHSTT